METDSTGQQPPALNGDPTSRQTPFPVDWPLWGKWLLANLGGWLAGWLATWPLNLFLAIGTGLAYGQGWNMAIVTRVEFILSLAVVGAVVGLLQWLVLRERVAIPRGRWVLVTAGGWVIPLLPGFLSGGEAGLGLGFAISAVVGLSTGAIVGLLQWLVLRRHLPQAGWWIGANAIGWLACGAFAPASVTVTAALTGFTLLWLLQQPRPEKVTAARVSSMTSADRHLPAWVEQVRQGQPLPP